MSYDDNNRHDPDRGAYTPPDDDDLPFRRGFDARRPETKRPVPMMLIISVTALLVLLAAVGLIYGIGGVRSDGEGPPLVGEPVGDLTGPAPVDAQPVDPEADISAYDAAPENADPVFAPPPEEAQPRPEPRETPEAEPLPPAKAAATPNPAAAEDASPPRAETAPAAPRPEPAAGGSSSVQIGAFSSTAIADREYAAVAGAFPEFARGRTKGVQQVTTSSGQTVYRTTFNGFSREQALAFCTALRNAGRDCIVR